MSFAHGADEAGRDSASKPACGDSATDSEVVLPAAGDSEETSRLFRWIELAERFTFVPIKIQSHRTFQSVIRMAEARFGREQIAAVDLYASSPDKVPVLLVAAGQGRRAVFASGFSDEPRPQFTRLNQQREAVSAQMGCVLVVGLLGDELHAFIDAAPDFWSIRSTFLTLAATPLVGIREEPFWGPELEPPDVYSDQLRRLEGLPGPETAARRARVYLLLGQSLASHGRIDEARQVSTTARALALELGDARLAARALLLSGQTRLQEFDFTEAERNIKAGLDEFRQVGDRSGEAMGHRLLGQAAWYQGRYGEATRLLNRAIHVSQEVGDRQNELVSLVALAEALASDGLRERASVVASRALHLAEETGYTHHPAVANARMLLSILAGHGDAPGQGAPR